MAEQLLAVAGQQVVATGVADELVGSDLARPQDSNFGPIMLAGSGDWGSYFVLAASTPAILSSWQVNSPLDHSGSCLGRV